MNSNSQIDISPYQLAFGRSPAAFALLHVTVVDGAYDDLVFVYTNDSYEKMSGFPAAVLNGHSYSEIWGKKNTEWNEMYGKVAYEGKEHSDIIFGAEIGRYVSIQCHQARPGYCAAIFLDITDQVVAGKNADNKFRKKYELERQRTLRDNSIMAYAVFDLQKRETIEIDRSPQLAPIAPNAALEEFRDDVASCIVSEEQRRQYRAMFDPDALIQKFRGGESEQHIEFMRKLPSGKVIWVKSRFYLMEEPNGTDTLLIYSCNDINIHKSLEIMTSYITQEDYDMMGYVNFADDSAIMWYGKNSLQGGHAPEATLVEETYSNALDWFIGQVVVPEEKEQYRTGLLIPKIRAELSLHEHFMFSVHVKGENGALLTKEIRYSMFDRNADVCMFTQTDITDVLAEKEQEKKALENALDQMRQANATQSDFLAKMSHELRTPLNVIIGSSALAQDVPDTNQEMQEYVRQIDYSAKYLLSMINDILDARKMERGEFKLQYSWAKPGSVLTPALAMMASEFRNHNIRFDVIGNQSSEPDTEYYLDVIRCRQIVTNLLNNALKFTPSGGSVSFAVNHLGKDDATETVQLVVSDTGCGMSRKFQEKMFEPFTQERIAGLAGVQGTGLGLSVVKQLVDGMHGTIAVQSELYHGAAFTITLPLKWRKAAAGRLPSAGKAPSVDLTGKHILLCEDHPVNAAIAKKLLEKQGMIVETASNGAEGLAAFQAHEDLFDAILMDIRMPVMDGLEAAKAIRALDSGKAKSIPLIAMTANAYDEDIQKSFGAGMNAHLAKPIDPHVLYATIAGVLQEKTEP